MVGSGAFGQVWLVRRRRDGVCFALKVMDIRDLDARDQRRLLTELRLHNSFNCPFIVPSLTVWVQDFRACLLREYVEAGPLSRHIEQCLVDGTETPTSRLSAGVGRCSSA